MDTETQTIQHNYKGTRNILLDIDNTITHVDSIINKMAEVYGKDYISIDDLSSYNLADAFKVTKEADRMFWDIFGYEVLQSSLPNIKTIQNIYSEIITPDDYVYIVTARPYEFTNMTEQWLKHYGIPYHELILCGSNSKAGFIENLDIDVIIDDNPKLFLELEHAKRIMPNLKFSQKINEGRLETYVVRYPYNETIKSSHYIDPKTGVISKTGGDLIVL